MSNNPQTRKMRFRQVERCLDSGMQINQWCKLNKAPQSTFYSGLKVYRESSSSKENVIDKFFPWSECVPNEIKPDAKESRIAREIPDDPIIDIDEEVFRDEGDKN